MIKGKGISNYKEFVDLLDSSLNFFQTKPRTEWENTAIKYVDGLAAEELRKLVALETRRKHGVFFTDSKLAKKVLHSLKPNFNDKSVIYDPACGAGNLLIAAYDFIQKKEIYFDDKEHFLGTDIHREFIEAARLRCSINQLLYAADTSQKNEVINSLFNFSLADGLKQNTYYHKANHIVVNPPFNLVTTKENLNWSNGKVSAAALFMDKIIENANPGTFIYAILPDVLRSGSRYEKWRKMIQEKCITGTTKLLGQFDKFADVDVFGIKLTKRLKNVSFVQVKPKDTKTVNGFATIDNMFDICVGPVVDNRDPHAGPILKYIVSKGLKGWTKQINCTLSRKHLGKSFKSPFVVIKRTSRMGDSQRAVATLINFANSVFVDNHLIILKPKSGRLKDCIKVLKILKEDKTDEWLNKEIRCRHLTVKVVSKIPLWE